MRIDRIISSHAVNFIKWNEREMKMTTTFEVRYLANIDNKKQYVLANIDYSSYLEKNISVEQAKESALELFERLEPSFVAW